MDNNPQPIFAKGKICYIEIPALDIQESLKFYQIVFGWNLRKDDTGNISFDDTVGQVSGMWVTGRKPSTEPGLLISIIVDNITDTLKAITDNGGKIVKTPANTESSEVIALFSDPAGNVFCLYQNNPTNDNTLTAVNKKSRLLQVLLWVAGIILAGVASLWPANLIMHHTGKVDMNNLTAFQYWVQFLVVPSLAFGLFVFLSCLFVPFFKKYAGVLVFSLSIIFIALGAWQHYADDGILRNQYIVRYTGFIIFMIAGFILSHKMFVKNKWATKYR